MIYDTNSAQISQKQDKRNLYAIMKTVHHVPKCMSCHKAIVVITGRAHCFHDNIYITLILLLWDLSTLCVVDHLYIYIYIRYTMKGFWSGKTDLPTSFAQRFLQGRKCYSLVICDVEWFGIEDLTWNIIVMVMLQLPIEFSNRQW